MLHFVNSSIKFAQSLAFYIVDFISNVKICQGHLCQFYIDHAFIFHEVEFNAYRSLAYYTSMVIEQHWLFCYNWEEEYKVFKIIGLSHVAMMRYVAFLGQWGEVNKIDCELILGEVQQHLTSVVKNL